VKRHQVVLSSLVVKSALKCGGVTFAQKINAAMLLEVPMDALLERHAQPLRKNV